MIRTTCECGASYQVKDELAGKRIRCKKCGEAVAVSGTAQTSVQQRERSSADPAENSPTPTVPEPSVNVAKCPDCSGKVSQRASSCPHCGAPLHRYKRAAVFGELFAKLFANEYSVRWILAYASVCLVFGGYGLNSFSQWRLYKPIEDRYSDKVMELKKELWGAVHPLDQARINATLASEKFHLRRSGERARESQQAVFSFVSASVPLLILLGCVAFKHLGHGNAFLNTAIFGGSIAGIATCAAMMVFDYKGGMFRSYNVIDAYVVMPLLLLICGTGIGHSRASTLSLKDKFVGIVSAALVIVFLTTITCVNLLSFGRY